MLTVYPAYRHQTVSEVAAQLSIMFGFEQLNLRLK
jgi:hypothetical protein